jgi:hypothetical protein
LKRRSENRPAGLARQNRGDAAAQQKFIDDARTAIAEIGDLTWRFAINLYSARRSEEEQPPMQPA